MTSGSLENALPQSLRQAKSRMAITKPSRWRVGRLGPARAQLVADARAHSGADAIRDHVDKGEGGETDGERGGFELGVRKEAGEEDQAFEGPVLEADHDGGRDGEQEEGWEVVERLPGESGPRFLAGWGVFHVDDEEDDVEP